MNLKILNKTINGSMAQLKIAKARKVGLKTLVDLIMIQVDVKIGLFLAIVYLVIAVFIPTIEAIIKLAGKWKKITRKDKSKELRDLKIEIATRNPIILKIWKSTNLNKYVSIAMKHLRNQLRFLASIFFAGNVLAKSYKSNLSVWTAAKN